MAQVVQLFVYQYNDIQKLTLLNFRHVVCPMFSRSLTSCVVILSILDEFPGSDFFLVLVKCRQNVANKLFITHVFNPVRPTLG